MPLPFTFDRTQSWNDFTALDATLSERDRGTAFEYLVRHYLLKSAGFVNGG